MFYNNNDYDDDDDDDGDGDDINAINCSRIFSLSHSFWIISLLLHNKIYVVPDIKYISCKVLLVRYCILISENMKNRWII